MTSNRLYWLLMLAAAAVELHVPQLSNAVGIILLVALSYAAVERA